MALTSKQIRTMTQVQILDYWKAEQRRKRDAGEEHYDCLTEQDGPNAPKRIVATID